MYLALPLSKESLPIKSPLINNLGIVMPLIMISIVPVNIIYIQALVSPYLHTFFLILRKKNIYFLKIITIFAFFVIFVFNFCSNSI